MAKGWMSKDPSEMTARQQRRMQFLEKRGRGGQVQAQPTEMPEMTARQQRRQRYIANRDARRQKAVEDYRAQQQAQRMETPFGGYTRLSDRELYEMGYDPRDFNQVSRGPDGQIISTLMGHDMSPLDPQERERLWQERLNNPRPTYSPNASPSIPLQTLTPEQLVQARTMFGGFGGQGYDKMLRLPPGQTQEQAAEAAMQEPMRTPTPEFVNAMPGQLRTGTFTPQGMYRPLPYNATPQQIRERQALIQGGHYFNQLTPAQRMR